MSPNKARRVSDLLLGIMFCCLIGLTCVPDAYFGLLFWIILIIIVALVVIDLKYLRCPECGVHLGRAKGSHCPLCGTDMDTKPEEPVD